MDVLAPITFPFRTLTRAIDDLHAIAQLARELVTRIDVLERLDERAGMIVAMGERMDERAQEMLGAAHRIDERGTEIVELGGRLDDRGQAVLELGAEVNETGREMLPEARLVHLRAQEVVEQATQIAAVLPTLKRAFELVEPLEGVADRLGRIVDRLPGETWRRRLRETAEGPNQRPPA